MTFPDYLRSHRASSGYTRGKLAFLLGTTENEYYRWESGKRLPSKEKLRRIADFYHENFEDLANMLDIKQRWR